MQRRLLSHSLHQHGVRLLLQQQLYGVVLAKLTGTVECSFAVGVALVHLALVLEQHADYVGVAIGPAIDREEKGCPEFVRCASATFGSLADGRVFSH